MDCIFDFACDETVNTVIIGELFNSDCTLTLGCFFNICPDVLIKIEIGRSDGLIGVYAPINSFEHAHVNDSSFNLSTEEAILDCSRIILMIFSQ
jgi:hypothetical protein